MSRGQNLWVNGFIQWLYMYVIWDWSSRPCYVHYNIFTWIELHKHIQDSIGADIDILRLFFRSWHHFLLLDNIENNQVKI